MSILLVPPDPEMASCFFEWRQDPRTIKYNPLAPATIESLRERLMKSAHDLSNFESVDAFMWFVSFEGEVVGQVNLANINRMMLTAEVGYTMSPKMRSRGIATEAVRLLVKNAFELTPLRKLVAYVHEDNVASRKVLAKLGFKQEGLLREHYIINGKPANEAVYGILRGELV